MSSQPASSENILKRVLPLEKKSYLQDSFNDSGIEACENITPSTPTVPLSSISNQSDCNETREPASPINACWAPKRRRMISRLNRKEMQPKRLFQDDNVENDENDENNEEMGRQSPERNELNQEQIQRLLMAPRRPNISRDRNRNMRPIRLFQNIDHGYITDEDPQSEGSENNFSMSPGKFPVPFGNRQNF